MYYKMLTLVAFLLPSIVFGLPNQSRFENRDVVGHDNVDRYYGDVRIVPLPIPGSRRSPAVYDNALLESRAAFPIPRPLRSGQTQQQKNEQEVKAVNQQQKADAKDAKKTINDAHTKAVDTINNANSGEQWGNNQLKAAQKDNCGDSRNCQNKLISAENDKITAQKNGEWKKKYAQYQEKNTDTSAINNFAQKSNTDQTTNFNTNGDAKSDAQKAKEKALAGFMKFLNVFEEILSVLTIALPGAGEVLSVGMHLAEAAGKAAEDITKIAKGAYKAEKFGEKVRNALGMQGGPQVIQGVSGKEMADLQKDLINQLIGQASKNLGATADLVKDTAEPLPQQKLPKCHGPRVMGCTP
ncbi:MAG: hypothetical protein MMC33_003982 [Icmadophila ericetorum]|nr:hypothetical protein [Icmadophila ericetorum]